MNITHEVRIDGLGLAVNGPAEVIYNALVDAGYEVEMPEFAGQNSGKPDRQPAPGEKVIVKVNPMPWGG